METSYPSFNFALDQLNSQAAFNLALQVHGIQQLQPSFSPLGQGTPPQNLGLFNTDFPSSYPPSFSTSPTNLSGFLRSGTSEDNLFSHSLKRTSSVALEQSRKVKKSKRERARRQYEGDLYVRLNELVGKQENKDPRAVQGRFRLEILSALVKILEQKFGMQLEPTEARELALDEEEEAFLDLCKRKRRSSKEKARRDCVRKHVKVVGRLMGMERYCNKITILESALHFLKQNSQ